MSLHAWGGQLGKVLVNKIRSATRIGGRALADQNSSHHTLSRRYAISNLEQRECKMTLGIVLGVSMRKPVMRPQSHCMKRFVCFGSIEIWYEIVTQNIGANVPLHFQ